MKNYINKELLKNAKFDNGEIRILLNDYNGGEETFEDVGGFEETTLENFKPSCIHFYGLDKKNKHINGFIDLRE